MDQQQTRDYVAKVRRRRRFWRRWGRPLAVLAVIAALVTPVALEYAGCRYYVAREGINLPTLHGLTIDEARDRLDECLRLEVVSDGLAEDHEDAVIVWQHPSLATTGSKVVNDLSPIQVRLGTAPDPPTSR